MSLFRLRARLLSRIAAAFLLTSAMTSVAGVAQAFTYTADQKEDAYWQAKYTYCDAEKLGQYWREATYDAKLAAGQKILDGDLYLLNDALTAARKRFSCPDPSSFNYDDSTKLADLWTSAPHS